MVPRGLFHPVVLWPPVQEDKAEGEDFQLNHDRETEELVQRDKNIKDIKCIMIYFRKEINFQRAAYVFSY